MSSKMERENSEKLFIQKPLFTSSRVSNRDSISGYSLADILSTQIVLLLIGSSGSFKEFPWSFCFRTSKLEDQLSLIGPISQFDTNRTEMANREDGVSDDDSCAH